MLNTTALFLASLRGVLQEPEEGLWTDALLVEYLNAAKDQVWLEFLDGVRSNDAYAAESSAYDLVAGQEEYDLPSDFMRLLWAEWIFDSGLREKMTPLRRRSRGKFETLTDAALRPSPPAYYVKRPKIGIVPLPREARTDAFVLHYLPELDDMVSGQGWTELSDLGIRRLDRAIVVRAAAMAKHLDESADSGLIAEYNLALKSAIDAADDEFEDGPEPDTYEDVRW